MNKEEILNKYIDLIDKGYCSDCNELNCIDNFPQAKITHAIRELQQENQELKKQLHEASLTIQEMTEQDIECPSNCEKLRQLKKQLEEKENIACNWKDSCLENAGKIEELENQQKEFIKYLEEEIKIYSKTTYAEEILKELEEILQKYKSVIGDDK